MQYLYTSSNPQKMITKFENSIEEGPHQQLNLMNGNWKGIVRTWFEPDKIANEAAIEGTIKPVLGGRFLMHEYTSSFTGNPLEGIMIFGYDLNTRSYQSAWIDSFHMGTGIMFSKNKTEDGAFNVSGGYEVNYNNEEQIWGWRTEMKLENAETLVITSYNITPGGEESLANEIRYERIE